jgi:hypothetical protein
MSTVAASASQLQECIVECDSCHDLCVETTTHCLEMGGAHAAPTHMTLLMDCAEICQVAADFMLRGSEMHRALCRVCAEVCDACAASCTQLEGAEMAACAEACLRCAQTCRGMAS